LTKTKKSLTITEAALELGISDQQIYNLLRVGALEAFTISVSGNPARHSLRISSKSIDTFLETRRIDPETFFSK
jgi:hypothetical protein